MVQSNAGTTGKSKAKWVLLGIVVMGVFTVNVIWWYVWANQRHLPEPRRDALTPEQRWAKFSAKYLERVSFPETYDGQPSPDALPEKREKIVEVHSQYWRNYAQIDQARFWFSYHTYHNGKPAPTNWDMDAQVDMRYGYGIEVEGEDADRQHFHVALNPQGRLFPAPGSGDLSSLMLSMFEAFRAKPKECSRFVDVQENVTKEGDPMGSRYNVLIAWITASDFPSGRVEVKHWFNQETGMLEKIEYCDPKLKSQYGHYAHIIYTYTQCNGVYIPTNIVLDFPQKGNRITEEYSDITIKKRAVPL